jgi:hypothetical protein
MGLTKNITYEQIVAQFQLACDEHLAIASFDSGTIDYLDASAVNRLYPYVFLRPLSTVQANRVRTLTFELYSLDQPKVQTQSNTQVISNTELYIYDILAWFNFGPTVRQQTYEVDMISGIPVNEAFQDRLYGWMANVQVITPWIEDYCNYPDL